MDQLTNRANFEDLLRIQLKDGDVATFDRLHVISLDQVAAAFGAEWGRIRERAMAIAERVLTQSLTARDGYLMQDDRFVVIFAGLSMAEASIKANQVARRIREKLIGAQGTAMNGIDIAASLLDVRQLGEGAAARLPRGARAYHHAVSDEERLGNADNLVRRVLNSVEISYVPVWSLQAQQVFGYRLYPSRAVRGKVVSGEAILIERAYDPMVAYLDLFMLETAADMIARGLHNDAQLVVPVHMGTFLNEGKREFEQFAMTLAADPWRQSIVYELIGVNDDTSRAVLENALRLLSPSAKFIIVRCETEASNIEYVKDLGVRHLGISLHAAFISPFGKKTIRKYISHFGNDCLRRGFHTFIWGVDTRLDAQLSIGAGYAMLAGSLFGKPREQPIPPYPVSQRSLFQS
ncbi:EAL domain-containing protein [Azospirillum sp. TSO22-1]|uniref:EAL domain-containing protein n=1 Tax=Azospirillum sp. TSO22-1 TaxID=716789 RepID=UPI000D649E33|nr:EAL domain-containing protein [Azospirillum sp. TSO22-1]